MKNFKLLKTLFLSIMLLGLLSCGDDDSNDPQPNTNPGSNNGGTTISLDDLNRGEGIAVTSGTETVTYESIVVGQNLQTTIDGTDYNWLRLIVNQEGNSSSTLSVSFYIPSNLNRFIPENGSIPVSFQLAGFDETYASMSVITENDAYDSNSLTTGTLTVSNASTENNSFDIVFDIQKLTSFDDGEINIQGALRF